MAPPLKLSESAAVHYLLERGLLTPTAIVEGNLTVADSSRRNRNLQVLSDRPPSYLLKQAAPGGGGDILAREAAVYERLNRPAEGAPMAPFLPRCYGHDPEAGILVIDLIRDGENLVRYHERLGRCPAPAGRAMGLVLGRLHSRVPLEPTELAAGSRLPFVFSLVRPGRSFLQTVSFGCQAVVKALQCFPAFVDRLAELGRQWRTEAFIHGDLKWDHFLRLRTGGPMKLVDWELAGPGDPCWDVGAILAEYLTFWSGGIGPGREPSRYPISQVQPAIRAFWKAYVGAAELTATTAPQQLLRSTRYCGARLLQNAYQQMQAGTQLTEHAVILLQLSWNVLQRPRDAAATLFGFPLEEVGAP